MRSAWLDSNAVTPSKCGAKSKYSLHNIIELTMPTTSQGTIDNSKLFNFEHLKGKIQDLVNDVEQNGRCNPRNLYMEAQSCIDIDTARSTDGTKSSEHSSAQKNRSLFRKLGSECSYMSIQTSSQRGVSEETINKMKEECQDRVKKMYLSKFKKTIQVCAF